MHNGVKIVGTGSYVPERVLTNDDIVRAIPGWTAQRIFEKTGIEERRFLHPIDLNAGRRLEIPLGEYPRCGVDMAEISINEALNVAGLHAGDLDAILYLCATPDELNFSHDAILLHKRLGCRAETMAYVIDAGCGSAMAAMHSAQKLVRGGGGHVAIVAVHLPSAYLDREVFTSTTMVGGSALSAALTMYLFGDGAGAVILGPASAGEPSGFLASYSGTGHSELMVRRGGGANIPPHPGHATNADLAFYINGKKVAEEFPIYMDNAIAHVRGLTGLQLVDFDHYFLHQANKRIVEKYAAGIGLDTSKLAMHMDKYGNLNAAATLVLLSEKVRSGKATLGSGQLALFAAIGAGIHFGAHAVRL